MKDLRPVRTPHDGPCRPYLYTLDVLDDDRAVCLKCGKIFFADAKWNYYEPSPERITDWDRSRADAFFRKTDLPPET